MVWSVSAPAGFGVRLGVATVWAGPLSSTHFVDKPELFHCTWRARLWHWTGFGLGEWARVRLRAGTRVGTWLRSWYTSLMLLFFILYLLFILIIVFHFWYFLCNIPTISWLVWYLNSDHNWVADTLASLGVKILVLVALSSSASGETLTLFVAEGVVWRTLLDPPAAADALAGLAVEVVVWSTFLNRATTNALAFSPAPIVSWGTSVVVWTSVDTFALLQVKFLVVGTSTAYTSHWWFHIASTFSKLREINMRHDTAVVGAC